MLRQNIAPSAPWYERTKTAMKSKELDTIENLLRSQRPVHLFGRCRDEDVPYLWKNSYDGMEFPYYAVALDTKSYEQRILQRLPQEVLLLTASEYGILHRLLIQNGSMVLMSHYDLYPCISLVRRMWAYTSVRPDGTVVLKMPDAILFALFDQTNRQSFVDHSVAFSEYIHTTELILLNRGILSATLALTALRTQLGRKTCNDSDLCLRFLKAQFTYTYLQGQMMLIHPGIFDPSPFASAAPSIDEGLYSQDMISDYDSWDVPSNISDMLCGLFFHAVRSEVQAEDLMTDLVLLARQNAPYEALVEVLEHNLLVQPTQEMLECLRLLKSHVPVWPVYLSEVPN